MNTRGVYLEVVGIIFSLGGVYAYFFEGSNISDSIGFITFGAVYLIGGTILNRLDRMDK